MTMTARKVMYSVGISNKFSAFEDGSDTEQVTFTNKDAKAKVPTSNTVLLNKSQKPANKPSKKEYEDKHIGTDSNDMRSHQIRTTILTEEQLRDTRAMSPKRGNMNRDSKHKSGSQRVFDRKSGTGRGKEMKKHGEGGHNWGGVTDVTKAIKENRYVSIDGAQEIPIEDHAQKIEMIDYLSYKQQQLSKRSKLPSPSRDQTSIPTDQEFRNSGYVKYIKKEPDNHISHKDRNIKVCSSLIDNINSKVNSGIDGRIHQSVRSNHLISFIERKSTSRRSKSKLHEQVNEYKYY
ncbi:hypothetical protein BEWA_007490 [Theileria equi strain WA]|uniref:Hyaluronan/mRNA-binding protein domain-containing protein n=1 Tax=Theileria equi strain WA TaxID=1537102 RepID=L0B0J9_THEEQ|nr:hypothetical protein BEWA_007490 [Theileria equi strain WA]AFZ81340.1 hypothetical protein BEWA_007490 [Theileria equi strain WA]|eukprot:XP_004831006.1 hypothetical protein BEWA_007490 [Theileria equi strain WA]